MPNTTEMKRKVVLFDTPQTFENLLPISYTRPVGDFRVGIRTIREKWESVIPGEYTYLTIEYLQEKFPEPVNDGSEYLFIAGNIVPDRKLMERVAQLQRGDVLADDCGLVAMVGTIPDYRHVSLVGARMVAGGLGRLRYVFDIFRLNGLAVASDFECITAGRESAPLPDNNMVIGPRHDASGRSNIFIEEGAQIEGAILNVKEGPIYIGRDAEVMEGSMLRGPLSIGEHSTVKMGAKIYGETTIGPWCKIGGELQNVVVFGYSNKAHDGYLGNAVIGEWCNIGAGANASNLKNDYSKIRIWNYAQQRFMRTDLQFCGLIMADHSKAGINTMFNTATVVGVGVNVHGGGFPRVFIPSFSSGSPEGGFTDVSIKKFMEMAGKVMARRGLEFSEVDQRILDYIYTSASRFKM